MRVVFISDLETLGGAGIGASRLAQALADAGHEVLRLYNNPDPAPFGERVTWRSQYVGPPRPLAVGLNGLRRFEPEASRRIGSAYSARQLERAVVEARPDVVHVHSIHNSYLDHAALARLDPDLPTVWTFHDCWSFAAESQTYVGADGQTKRLKPDGADREAAIAKRRRYFHSRRRLGLAGNSHFTSNFATECLELPVETIPYGLPLEAFSPRDRQVARQALRLPLEDFVVGFIADNIGADYKGFHVLREALSQMRSGGLSCVAIGDWRSGQERIGEIPIRHFGRVTNPDLLGILYSAANVFVVPSLAEALGLVGMESVACGTPVVGSRIGGIPDVVQEGTTGCLFPGGDSSALKERLEFLRANPGLVSELASTCRDHAEHEWPLAKQGARYIAIYDRLRRS